VPTFLELRKSAVFHTGVPCTGLGFYVRRYRDKPISCSYITYSILRRVRVWGCEPDLEGWYNLEVEIDGGATRDYWISLHGCWPFLLYTRQTKVLYRRGMCSSVTAGNINLPAIA
jgi:hypothetical protein